MRDGCGRRVLISPGAAMCCGAVGLMLLAGCNQAPAPASTQIDTKAAEDAVRAADVTWSKAAQARDLAGVLSYYANDAVVLAPNTPILTGAQAIHDGWAAMMTPNVAVA